MHDSPKIASIHAELANWWVRIWVGLGLGFLHAFLKNDFGVRVGGAMARVFHAFLKKEPSWLGLGIGF